MFSKFHRSQICRDKIRRSDIMTCVGSSQGWSIMVQATWSPTVQPCQPHGFGTLQEKLVTVYHVISSYIHYYPLLSMTIHYYPLLSITIHYYPKNYPLVSMIIYLYPQYYPLYPGEWTSCLLDPCVPNPSAETTKTKQFLSRQGCRAVPCIACPEMWFTCLLQFMVPLMETTMENIWRTLGFCGTKSYLETNPKHVLYTLQRKTQNPFWNPLKSFNTLLPFVFSSPLLCIVKSLLGL